MKADVDIAICGAGPVGLAFAGMLALCGAPSLRIALIDAKTLKQAASDPRSLALSHGSQQILQQIGAWPVSATAIHQIHVSRRGCFGRTLIDREEYKLPSLGYVARYGDLVASLANVVNTVSTRNITAIRPAQVETCVEGPDAVELQFADGRTLSASLLVQAEGGAFFKQESASLRRDYGQSALVAHTLVSAPIAHRAFERFTDEGPLALLPEKDGYALVWCGRPANIAQLLTLPDTDFLAELEQVFGQRLGRFTHVSPRNAFALGLNTCTVARARTVTIGNAAQTLHPVAGQGFNLGLRDAAVLARLLARDATPDMLKHFMQVRQSDRSVTIKLTDTMARIFAGAPGGWLSQSILGGSLTMIDMVQPLKRLLAEQMMFGRR